MTEKTKLSAAIYVRWNSFKQPVDARDEQLRGCLKRAAQMGCFVRDEDVYIDDAKEGWQARQALFDALERRRFDVVIVSELNRLGRDLASQVRFRQRLMAGAGVRLVTLDGLDTHGLGQRLDDLLPIIVAIHQARSAAEHGRRRMPRQR